ncbi:MAG: M55 family metallopeptidase [Peptoniphilus sp.]|nr:M55 family metallopeptidase [Peptoniphilus sp.]MDY6045103.1 M55 family metallopeptidase [Peptoniphilus sp.]
MNIYISFDMEGIAGIDRFSDEFKEPARYRDTVHAHLRAVIDGIKASPKNDEIERITVADSHGEGKNFDYLLLSEMDPRIELISGYPREDYMMTGLEGHDVAFLLGYHAGAGQHLANMDHTYSTHFHRVTVNDIKCSEALINQIYAKEKNVPIGLVIGDSGLYNQLIFEGYMPYVEYVTTKDSVGQYAVRHKNFQRVREEIVQKVVAVLDKDLSTLPLGDLYPPYSVTVEANTTLRADKAEMIPGVVRLDGYRLAFTTKDASELLNMLMALEAICRS